MKNLRKTLAMFVALITVLSLIPCVGFAIDADDEVELLHPKLSVELNAKLMELESDDMVEAYLITEEVPEEVIMEVMKATEPEYYEEYMKAKNSNAEIEIIESDLSLKDGGDISAPDTTIDDEVLQAAIEYKRSLYAKAYKQHFAAVNQKNKFTEEDIIFQSQFSPLMIVKSTKAEVLELCNSNDFVALDHFINHPIEPEASLASQIIRADYVRDTYGNKGAGVKIGQLEPAVPDKNVNDLKNAEIVCNSTGSPTVKQINHATVIAKIMVGNSYGLAPEAKLYSVSSLDEIHFYTGVDWLISQGVNVINMSARIQNSAYGVYDTPSKWLDHLAVMHDIHFVKSAGNRLYDDEGNVQNNSRYITSPGMAYNIITVGAYDDINTVVDTDDVFWINSCFNEVASTDRPEKPNLIAPGVDIVQSTGTSNAAPLVTGTIAQICSYKAEFKTKQTAMGAILMASAAKKIKVNQNGYTGFSFDSDEVIDGSNQISEKQGAGKLDSRWARGIAYYGNYWGITVNEDNFPYTKTVSINASSNSLTRVAIFWLKRNTLSGIHTISEPIEEEYTDLDLYIYSPSNIEVGKSITPYSNFEIVQFTPTESGTYRIVIRKDGTNNSEKEHIGIAVW